MRVMRGQREGSRRPRLSKSRAGCANLRKLQRAHRQNGLRNTSKMDFIVTWQPAATACAYAVASCGPT